MKVLFNIVFLFFFTMNIHASETEHLEVLQQFDACMADLKNTLATYINNLESEPGCWLAQKIDNAMATKLSSHIKWVKEQRKALDDIINSSQLTSTSRLKLIKRALADLKEGSDIVQKEYPDYQKVLVCSKNAPKGIDHFAKGFHELAQGIVDNAQKLLVGKPQISPDMLCIICDKNPSQYYYGCRHVVVCKSCDTPTKGKNLEYCPDCQSTVEHKREITYASRCEGCRLENVNMVCGSCGSMKFCEECLLKVDDNGELIHKCSFSCRWLHFWTDRNFILVKTRTEPSGVGFEEIDL